MWQLNATYVQPSNHHGNPLWQSSLPMTALKLSISVGSIPLPPPIGVLCWSRSFQPRESHPHVFENSHPSARSLRVDRLQLFDRGVGDVPNVHLVEGSRPSDTPNGGCPKDDFMTEVGWCQLKKPKSDFLRNFEGICPRRPSPGTPRAKWVWFPRMSAFPRGSRAWILPIDSSPRVPARSSRAGPARP
jgi:hypothetical protein